MNGDNGFPKFQWSKFKGPSRDEQYVIRADTLSELLEAIESLKTILEEDKTIDDTLDEAYEATKTCKVCGEQLTYRTGVSPKTNKKWGGWFCADKSHAPIWDK